MSLLSYPTYVVGKDQPHGQQKCLFGVYPGFLPGTGGSGDVHTAITSLESHVGASMEALMWSGSLNSLTCGAPFSGTGYDGTFAALTGCPQYVILGIPLVEGAFSHGSGNTSVSWAAASSTIFDSSATSSMVGLFVSGNGIPPKSQVASVNAGVSVTIKNAQTGAAAVTTAAGAPGSVAVYASNLRNTANGMYDAKFNAIFASLIARGLNGSKVTIRFGWEIFGSSWAWGLGRVDPATGTAQTIHDWQDAHRHVVDLARAAGFTGRVAVNAGGAGNPDWSTFDPGPAYVDVFEWDVYNSIHRADLWPADNPQGVWDNEISPAFDRMFAYARSQWPARAALGLEPTLCGFSEAGLIVQPSNTFRTVDWALWWPNIHDKLKANADVAAYIVFFNQNQYDEVNTISENSQKWYSVTSGTLSDQTAGKYRNTSTHGPWVDSIDNVHALSDPTIHVMWDNGMQVDPSASIPAGSSLLTHQKRRRRGSQIVFA